MYRITYRNVPNNIKVEEYCFWQKQEARRLFIDEENDLELVSCESLMPPFGTLEFWKLFWLCLTNYTIQKDFEKGLTKAPTSGIISTTKSERN